jgi:hypothetical protein
MDAIVCAGRSRSDLRPSYQASLDMLQAIPRSIETNWITMEIALAGKLTVGQEIEPPEFYAT